MARDHFSQILRVLCLNYKIAKNQQRSTDKLAPIRDVFGSIITRFHMAYTPNEHITTDKQVVVFRGKCPFHMFIKPNQESMGSNYGLPLMQGIFMPEKCTYTLAKMME